MELDQAITGLCRALRAAGRTEGTEESYGYLLAQWGRWLEHRGEGWATATEEDLEDFVEAYAVGHRPSSTALIGTCLRSFYRWAVRRKHIASSPAANLEPVEQFDRQRKSQVPPRKH